jgi:DNA-binding CsgD family transcriptional regulator
VEAGVLLWNPEQLAAVDSALDRARSGHPVVLIVTGDAGTGKTSLLDEAETRAVDFRMLAADGFETARAAFDVLAQWGVDVPREADDSVGDPFVAAQGLRSLIDQVSDERPVLLRVDDLQWADPESVEALVWLLRRATGDRLLVLAGARPLGPQLHASWQRWTENADHAVRISLTGLSLTDTVTLVDAVRPGVPRDVIERLRDHTGGNPLYLTALMAEFDIPELLQMRMLPAPAEFAQVIASRVARLDQDSVKVLRALAVLGTGWVSLPAVAAVGEVDDVGRAMTELLERDLAQARAPLGTVSLRVTHALVRSAVYQQIPQVERRRLHRLAAGVVADRSVVLEHRMAAAEQYDDDLAQAMATYSAQLYQQHSFRLAAQFLRWSSTLTRQPPHRERRWLESLFCSVMALDVDLVHAEAEYVARAADQPLRALVLGGLAVWERRFHDGIAVLEPAERELTPAVAAATRYRIEVLLAWARLCVNHDPGLIRTALERAAASRVADAGLDGSELVTAGGTAVRVDGFSAVLAGELVAAVPDQPAETPLALTKQLIWRGAVRARLGLYPAAMADLSEGTRRIQNGVTDFGRGAFHAFLALAQWMSGDWSRARLTARLALDYSGRFSHPMVLAMTALPAIGDGRLGEADDLLGRARAILERAPWWEACQLLVISSVARLHAEGSAADRAQFLPSLRGTPFDCSDLTNTNPVLRLHVAVAALWSGETSYAEDCAASMAAEELRAPWIPGAVGWIRGRIAVERGSLEAAALQFGSAATLAIDNLPLYHAHLLVDSADVARRLGRPDSARQLTEQARAGYERLGATTYLRSLSLTSAPEVRAAPAKYTMSEREQDVLTLVVAGMSYAQISRELFITQSTVSYHLSNLYDRTGVRRRHQLTELFRADPQAFGLAAAQ